MQKQTQRDRQNKETEKYVPNESTGQNHSSTSKQSRNNIPHRVAIGIKLVKCETLNRCYNFSKHGVSELMGGLHMALSLCWSVESNAQVAIVLLGFKKQVKHWAQNPNTFYLSSPLPLSLFNIEILEKSQHVLTIVVERRLPETVGEKFLLQSWPNLQSHLLLHGSYTVIGIIWAWESAADIELVWGSLAGITVHDSSVSGLRALWFGTLWPVSLWSVLVATYSPSMRLFSMEGNASHKISKLPFSCRWHGQAAWMNFLSIWFMSGKEGQK